MACTPAGINQDNGNCDTADGGIYQSYMTARANISAATFDVDGQITAFTMTSTSQWVKYVYDDDNTAFYNQEGERTGKKHVFNQSAFMKFEGINTAKVKEAGVVAGCCDMVWVHFLNDGSKFVQGLEDDGTGAIKKPKETAKATVNILSDTGDNTGRIEFTVNSVAKNTHLTTLSAAAIEAL